MVELTFQKDDTIVVVEVLPEGGYAVTEVTRDVENITHYDDFYEIGEWLVKNGFYINVHGRKILPRQPVWTYSPEAERTRREFIGYTIKEGESTAVLWDEFYGSISPDELDEAKLRLTKLIAEATEEPQLRAIFELFLKLGKSI
jgi:hypothetical protein